MTSFANCPPDPAFQVSETPIFTPDLCKVSLAAISFIRLAAKPALTSTPMLFVKARAVAEKLLLLALKVVWTWLSVIGVLSLPIGRHVYIKYLFKLVKLIVDSAWNCGFTTQQHSNIIITNLSQVWYLGYKDDTRILSIFLPSARSQLLLVIL